MVSHTPQALLPAPREIHGVEVRPWDPGDATDLLHSGGGHTFRSLFTEPVTEDAHPTGTPLPGATSAVFAAVTRVRPEVLALGWLTAQPGAGGTLAVALRAGYHCEEAVESLLDVVAAEAARRGIAHLSTCVTPAAADPFAQFRAANMHVESSIALGGVTEVVLIPGAAAG